jgi:hypothetical protein
MVIKPLKVRVMRRLFPIAVLTAIIFCSFHSGYYQPYVAMPAILMASDTTLPDSYKNRKFLGYDGGQDYDAALIPGNVVKYDSSSSGYEIMTLKGIVKGNKPALVQKPANAVIFSGNMTSTSSFNGSYLINGIKVEQNQEMNIEIRDDAIYSVPDGQVDTAGVRAAIQSLSANERKKFFYVISATVSIITYNIHDKSNATMDKLEKLSKGKPDTTKKGINYKIKQSKTPAPYSSAGSNSKMLTDKTISIVAVPVDDLAAVAPIKK